MLRKIRAPFSRFIRNRIDEIEIFINPPKNEIYECHEGDSKSKKNRRLCFFASFDPHGKVAEYVHFYVEELCREGVDVVFVTTSKSLNTADTERLKKSTLYVVRRCNAGLDWGSWFTGISLIKDFDRYEMVLITNDSIYAPFYKLGPLFEKVENDLDSKSFFGPLISHEIATHMPFYFVIFNRHLLRNGYFHKFWNNYRFYDRKERIIMEFEVGSGLFCKKNDIKLVPFFSTTNLKNSHPILDSEKEKELLQNATLLLWEPLIRDEKFPFLKTEVVKQNRYQMKNVSRWREVIRQTDFPQMIDYMEKHLSHIGIKDF